MQRLNKTDGFQHVERVVWLGEVGDTPRRRLDIREGRGGGASWIALGRVEVVVEEGGGFHD